MKMRILGLTLMAFFLFNGAAFAQNAKAAKGQMTALMARTLHQPAHTTGAPDNAGRPTGDGDGDTTNDDVTDDLMGML